MTQTFDRLARGGVVVTHDGEGRADIGVRDDRSVAIGDLRTASAGYVFNASGLLVLPGVIET